MHAIETRKLTRDFGGSKGLFDLDLQIPKGRVHGFLGPNGSGKTTAIRLLLDFLKPDRGAARVLGHNPLVDSHRIRAHIGYVPGDLAIPHMLTGVEYLRHSAAIHRHVDPDWRDHLVEIFKVNLDQKIGTLSKGNKQKVALIDALQHNPELLIMDEPTDGLDPLLRDQVGHVLRQHARKGGTVFLSSHVVHEIQTMCQDVSIVLGGRLREQARIEDLIALEGLVVEVTVPDAEQARAALADQGVAKFAHKSNRIRIRVRGNPLPALGTLHRLGASDPKLRQGDLEEMFLRLYSEENQ